MWLQMDAATETILGMVSPLAKDAASHEMPASQIASHLTPLTIPAGTALDAFTVFFEVVDVRLIKLNVVPRPIGLADGTTTSVKASRLGVAARVRAWLRGPQPQQVLLTEADVTYRVDALPAADGSWSVRGDFDSLVFIGESSKVVADVTGMEKSMRQYLEERDFNLPLPIQDLLEKTGLSKDHRLVTAAIAPRGWKDVSRVSFIVELTPVALPKRVANDVWYVFLDPIFKAPGDPGGAGLSVTLWHDATVGLAPSLTRVGLEQLAPHLPAGLSVELAGDVSTMWSVPSMEDFRFAGLHVRARLKGTYEGKSVTGEVRCNLRFSMDESGLVVDASADLGEFEGTDVLTEFLAWLAGIIWNIARFINDGPLLTTKVTIPLDQVRLPVGPITYGVVPVELSPQLCSPHFSQQQKWSPVEIQPVDDNTLKLLPQPGWLTVAANLVPLETQTKLTKQRKPDEPVVDRRKRLLQPRLR
jgi:hypothetical protein